MIGGRAALWALLALLGIVLAAALTWTVMRLTGVHIGLASAPVSVVRGLAPATPAGPVGVDHEVVTVTRTVTVTGAPGSAAPATPPPAPRTTATTTTAPATTPTAPAAPATTPTAPPTTPAAGSPSDRGSPGGGEDPGGGGSRRDD